jgi:hypothetical protein
MRRITVLALLLTLCLTWLPAQQHPQKRNFLLNRDVVTLAKAGFPERIIIDTIRTTPSRFDVTAEALAALSGQGISQRLVKAMLLAKNCGSASDLTPSRCDPEPEKSSPAGAEASAEAGLRK